MVIGRKAELSRRKDLEIVTEASPMESDQKDNLEPF
jgi:hypothetical protein